MASDTKLESRLNIKDFEALQDAFSYEGDGYNNQLSLDRDQFIEALSLILNKGTRDEYGNLFDKVDTAKEGTVDWNKLASHILLEFYERDDKVKSNLLPQWKDLKHIPGPHKDSIQRIAYIRSLGRYLIISKEGNVSLWGQDVKLQKNIKTCIDTCRQRDLWITDFVPMQNVGKVALAFTSKEIGFYDMNVKLDFNCQYKIVGLSYTPLCLDYWCNPDNSNESVMLWGDVSGHVNMLYWSSASIALFERLTSGQDKEGGRPGGRQSLCSRELPTSRFEISSKTTMTVKIDDLIKGRTYKSVRFVRHPSHMDWIRQVKFIPHLECFISCSTSGKKSMVIAWMEKRAANPAMQATSGPERTVVRESVFAVLQGINAFDFHVGLNLIATAGVNNHVSLWNPYVISKPNGLLRGHMAPVLQVKFVPSRGQLISFSKDKVLRIWDVQLQVCIQRIAGVFPKGQEDDELYLSKREMTSILFYHDDRSRLFITFNYTLTMLEMKPETKDKIQSHEKPIVAALFNTSCKQVITACQGGTIIFWMVDTGQKVKTITGTHDDAELTCIIQDESEGRLYTGSTDGTVKIWDYNGHCYHQLICAGGNPADIGQILLLRRAIIVVGYSRDVTIFRNNTLRDFHVEPSEWKSNEIEHWDDIMAAAFYPTQTLVTGSYDGEIVVWNTNSEQATRRMTERSKVKKEKFTFSSTVVGPAKSVVPDSKRSKSPNRPNSRNNSLTLVKSQENDDEDEANINEFMFTISRLIFLHTRKQTFTQRIGANLMSCGGNGIVRFWNVHTCKLIAEYIAHEHAGSIIMNVDASNKYLVTGDVDGLLKVWDIERYAFDDGPLLTEAPPQIASWQAHSDMISSINFCERQKRILVISSSSDCAAALWDIHGHKIGIFGQEEHWKIEDEPDIRIVFEEKEEEADDEEKKFETSESSHSMWEPDPLATEDPDEYRINTWNITHLGKDYQELRVKKRQRIQPGLMPDLPYLYFERTGQPPFGPFYSLETSNMQDVEELEQPDFIEHPEKYFTDKEDLNTKMANNALQLSESNRSNIHYPLLKNRINLHDLKAAFDEKSLFPRYIRDYEHQMKKFTQINLDLNTSLTKSQNSKIGAAPSSNSNIMPRRPKPGMKLKPLQRSRELTSVSSLDSKPYGQD